MKNILLLTLACLFLVGCEVSKDSGVSGTQRDSVAQFSAAVSTALQTMDAKTIYNRGNRSMPKAVADEVKNCEAKPQRDGAGRLIGSTLGGALCPIRAQWILRDNGANVSTVDLSYRSQDDSFTQILPVAIMTLDGTRTATPFGGSYRIITNYRGSARDTSDDVVSFDVNIDGMGSGPSNYSEYTYTIKIAFRDFSVEGRMTSNNSYSLNGSEISRQEFENLFFFLK